MDNYHIIEVVFTDTVTAVTATGLVQWDYGQYLHIKGLTLNTVSEVHFSNSKEKEAIVAVAVQEDDYVKVQIPDVLLTKDVPITAYIYTINETSGETIRTITLNVVPRPKPQNFSETYPDAEYVLSDIINEVNAIKQAEAEFETEMQQQQDDFEEYITGLVGSGMIDDEQTATGTTWSSSKINTEIQSTKTTLEGEIGDLEDTVNTHSTSIGQNASDIEALEGQMANALMKADIQDTSTATDKLWSSDKVNTEIESLEDQIAQAISDSKPNNVQVDFTIASYTTNTGKEGTDLAYYADIDCEGATPDTTTEGMEADITPDPDVTTADDKGLLTYTDIVEANKVRCYFSEQPASPYKIKTITLTKVKKSSDPQPATVALQVQNEYTAAKLAKQQETLNAQQESLNQQQAQFYETVVDEETTRTDIELLKTDVATLKEDNLAIKGDLSTINDTVEDQQEVDTETTAQIMSLMSVGYAQTVSYMALGNDPQPYAGTYVSQAPLFEYGHEYKKGDLFQYEGAMGFVKQDHTSQETWKPFSTGTESLYGARPCPVNGIYPWTYNMAVEKGMKVSYNGVTYEAIQDAPDCIWTPDSVPAIFKVVE